MIPKDKIADRYIDNIYLCVAIKNRIEAIKHLSSDSKIMKKFKSLNNKASQQIWRNKLMIKIYKCPLYSWWIENWGFAWIGCLIIISVISLILIVKGE